MADAADPIIVAGDLGRLQACVDQVVGYCTIIAESPSEYLAEHVVTHVLGVMQLLQDNVDGLVEILGAPSALDYGDGAVWLVTQINLLHAAGSLRSTGINHSNTRGSSSRPASSTERSSGGPRWI